ncbi:MAG: DEAD/DEAH box helicase family protein [Intrasporangiaceae bacterium]|nr:DEAD/DEAH box helicase family protein [Intrasporangiaceae bacterium]
MTALPADADWTGEADDPFATMAFRYPWRTYQQLALSRINRLAEDPDTRHEVERIHLVAPPGSGKTILGLELARRRGHPTLVLSPTTTIASQWRSQLAMFLPEQRARQVSSDDPDSPGAITSLTYQRLGVLDAADQVLRMAARDAWVAQLVTGGHVPDAEAALVRITRMEIDHPANHRRELARHLRAQRRRLIDEGGVLPLLHPNARALIDRLAEHGVGTIILDECHHLLDHWALVVRALLERLGDDTQVIGLTATLPDPEDRRSYDNYMGILGEVTFEVPTPAVVKEGDLAPWRDLAWFVEPTRSERRVLDDASGALRAVVAAILGDDRLTDFARTLAFGDVEAAADERHDPEQHLADQLSATPLRTVAATRLLDRRGAWPRSIPVPDEARQRLTFDDELLLLERYGLDVLAVSAHSEDHALLAQLRDALTGFGISLTERGLRHGRSVGDLILAFSEAKDHAVIELLGEEERDLGERLRAVVVTDFAVASSAVARAAAPLAEDAGSAFRAFHSLIDDPRTEPLDPMMITGRTVLVDAGHGDELLAALNAQLEQDGLDARCRYELTGDPRVLEIVGEGPAWSSATYVRLLTEVFESGATRCLVGTRGLFGEGWDALTLNTLVDLTSVTTSTSVRQLRGRSIRLDPEWPRKVSHNWDVVCVAPKHPRGDADLRRLARRHGQLWGIVPPRPGRELLETAMGVAAAAGQGSSIDALPGVDTTVRGQVARGLVHVSPELASDVMFRAWDNIPFERHTARSRRAIGRRDRSHDWWGIGQGYDNFAYRTTRVSVDELSIRTVHTIADTLGRLVRRAGIILLGALLFGAYGGWAVLEALQDAELVSPHIDRRSIRVRAVEDGSLEVVLDQARGEDAVTFTSAYQQALGPVGDPRYVIRRTDARLPSLPLSGLWLALRTVGRPHLGRPSYHPVPDVLGVNRDRAEAFAATWRRYVGGGELTYTRSDEGRRILLAARAQRPRRAKSYAFDRWR